MFPSSNSSKTLTFSESSPQQYLFEEEKQRLLTEKHGTLFLLEAAQKGKNQDDKALSAKERVFIEDVLSPMVKGYTHSYEGAPDLISFITDEGKFTEKFIKEFNGGFESEWLENVGSFVSLPSFVSFEEHEHSVFRPGTKDKILAFLNVMKGKIGVEETRKNLVIKRNNGLSFFPAGFLRFSTPLSFDGCNQREAYALSNALGVACRLRFANDEGHFNKFTKEVCSTLGVEYIEVRYLEEQKLNVALQLVLTLVDNKKNISNEEIVVGLSLNAVKSNNFDDLASEISKAILTAKKMFKQKGKELVFVRLNLFDIFVPIDAIVEANPSSLAKNFKEALALLNKNLNLKKQDVQPSNLLMHPRQMSPQPLIRGAEASALALDSDEVDSKMASIVLGGAVENENKGAIPKLSRAIASLHAPKPITESSVRAIVEREKGDFKKVLPEEKQEILTLCISDFLNNIETTAFISEAQMNLIQKMPHEDLIEALLFPVAINFIRLNFDRFKLLMPELSQNFIEPSAKLFLGSAAASCALSGFLQAKELGAEQLQKEGVEIIAKFVPLLQEKLIQDYVKEASQ